MITAAFTPLRVLIACESSATVRKEFEARGHYARSVDLLPTEQLSQAVRFRGDFGCVNHPAFDPTCEDCEHDEPWCHQHDSYAYECPCLGPTEDEAEYAESSDQGARHLTGDLFTVEDIASYDLLIAHPPCTRLTNSGVRWLKKAPPGRTLADMWAELDAGATFFRRILALPVGRIGAENPIPHKYALERIGQKYTQIIQPWQYGHGETKATCLWLKNLPPLTPTKLVAGREGRIHMLPPSTDRWKLRSKTYQGIAAAMADQWGSLPRLQRVAA